MVIQLQRYLSLRYIFKSLVKISQQTKNTEENYNKRSKNLPLIFLFITPLETVNLNFILKSCVFE